MGFRFNMDEGNESKGIAGRVMRYIGVDAFYGGREEEVPRLMQGWYFSGKGFRYWDGSPKEVER